MKSQSPDILLNAEIINTDEEKPKQNTFWRLLQIVVGVAAIIYVLSGINHKDIVKTLSKAHLLPLFGAVLTTLLMTYLMAWRWQMLIKVKYQINGWTLFVQYLIAQFFNSFTPGSVGGDLSRLLSVSKITGDRSFVFTSIVVERLVSFVGLVLSGLVGLYLGRSYFNSSSSFYALVGLLAVAIFLCLVLLSTKVMSIMVKVVKRVESLIGRRIISKAIEQIAEHLAVFSQKPLLILNIILSTFLVRFVWSLSCWLVAQSLDLNISLAVLIVLISLVDVARMLPIVPPNGIGVREFLLTLLLSPLGISKTESVVFSFVAYTLLIVNGLIGGIFYTSQAVVEKK